MITLLYNKLFFLDFSNYLISPFTFNTKPRKMVFERLVTLSWHVRNIPSSRARRRDQDKKRESSANTFGRGKNLLVLSSCIITHPLLWLTDEEKLGDCNSRRI